MNFYLGINCNFDVFVCFLVVERLTLLSQGHFFLIFLLILSSIIKNNNHSPLWIINFDKMRPRYPRVHVHVVHLKAKKHANLFFCEPSLEH